MAAAASQSTHHSRIAKRSGGGLLDLLRRPKLFSAGSRAGDHGLDASEHDAHGRSPRHVDMAGWYLDLEVGMLRGRTYRRQRIVLTRDVMAVGGACESTRTRTCAHSAADAAAHVRAFSIVSFAVVSLTCCAPQRPSTRAPRNQGTRAGQRTPRDRRSSRTCCRCLRSRGCRTSHTRRGARGGGRRMKGSLHCTRARLDAIQGESIVCR